MNTYGHYKPDAYEVVLFSTAEVKIAQDRSDDGKKSYFMMTWNDLFENIETNANLYEIICADQPRKFYLDFDGPRDELEKLKYNEESIMEHLTKRIRIYLRFCQFKDAPFDTTEINFLSSHTEKKISFHICIPAVVFANHKESKTMHLKFLEQNRDNNDPIVKFCDEAVYSMNRLWRLPFQSKINKDQILTICAGSTNYKDHIVTYTCDVPPQDVKWAMKTEEEPEKPIEFELTTENMDKARTCIKLIYDYVLDNKHSLCDETSGLIEYAKWKNLAFACLNCTNNDEEVFKLIFPLYRNHDPSKCDSEYINMARNASNYPYTIGTLIHYAQENPDYDELYGEEPIKKLLPKLVEEIVEVVDEDEEAFVYQDDGTVVKLEKKDDEKTDEDADDDEKLNSKIKRLILQAKKNTEYVQSITTFHDLCLIDCSKLYLIEDLRDAIIRCVYSLTDGGNPMFITVDQNYMEHNNKFLTYYSFNSSMGVGSCLFLYVQIVNEDKEKDDKGKIPPVNIRPLGGPDKSVLQQLSQFNCLKKFKRIVFEPYLYKSIYNSENFNLFSGYVYINDFLASTEEEKQMRALRYTKSKWYKHAFQVFCNSNPEIFEYYNNYYAHAIQYPTKIAMVMMTLISAQGIGKDTQANIMKNMIGDQWVISLESIDELFKSFNSEFENKMFIFVNEIKDKDKHFDKHDKLKDIITRTEFTVKKKYVKEYVIKSYARFIGHTNNLNPLHIEHSDRRHFMLKCGVEVDGVNIANNHEYFGEIYKTEVENPEFTKDAFFFFATRDIKDFKPQNFPVTDFMKNQKINSLNRIDKFLFFIPQFFTTDADFQEKDGVYLITYQKLFDKMLTWCKEYENCDQKITKTKYKDHLSSVGINRNKPIKINGVSIHNTYSLSIDIIQNAYRSYLRQPDFTLEHDFEFEM